MQSLRFLARIVPKSTLRPASSRCYSALSRTTRRPSWQTMKKLSYPAFSTSIARRDPAGDGDQLLAAKFENERALEIESVDPASLPPQIEEFKAAGIWEIVDKPGTHEITLQRTLGNETIKVECSITDMTDLAEDDEFSMDEEDGALGDEDYQQPKRTINQSGTKGGPVDVAPEDSLAPSDREGDFSDGSVRTSYPIGLDITITKPGNQVVEIRAQVHDGTVSTDTIQYLPPDSENDDNTTPYAGPPFSNLDADLQVMFEQYLEERGINAELASILPVLIEHKEQREYVDWLQNMQKFIEA